MDAESQHIKYLIVIAAVLCAVIIGYNAFYVPNADMSKISISTDTDSALKDEEYTPDVPQTGSTGAQDFTFSQYDSSESGAGSNGWQSSAAESSRREKSKISSALHGKININTADAKQLSELNGIGDTLAGRIVAYRQKNGMFKSIEDIKKVSGIGDKKFKNIKDNITV